MDCRFISQLLSIKKIFILAVFGFAFATFNVAADELKEITALTDQGQQAAALERINAYLAANPKDASGMFLKGIILVESGKRDDAIKTFSDLTEKYPNLPEPYNNLAVLYADAGQYDKAKKALETAIRTHPSYATAHENLGDIYARMASEAYDKALQLDNGNARAQNKLAMIKDLFGPAVASKPATSAKATPPAKVETAKAEVVAKVESAKPNKAGILPIRPADKKPEPVKVEAEKPVVNTTADDEKSVLEAVDNWAKAWSAKDADKYLASYAESFKPAKGESRKVWAQTRRERVSRPASINVEVGTPKVSINGADGAKVSFTQTYQADGKPIRTAKTLVMKKTNGAWLIDQEIASN
jgi:Flp pilus assembly protein TadD/ketosteroid isomerase-like protein